MAMNGHGMLDRGIFLRLPVRIDHAPLFFTSNNSYPLPCGLVLTYDSSLLAHHRTLSKVLLQLNASDEHGLSLERRRARV
jgi:hypothetical protein